MTPITNPTSMDNDPTNCLEARACPRCGQNEHFRITATSVFDLYDEGTSDHYDVEYDDDSPVRCPVCDWRGAWSETAL